MSWEILFRQESQKQYMKNILKKLAKEQEKYEILPVAPNIFRVFRETKYEDVKVCIIGQDPYSNPIYPTGLAFGVDNFPLPKLLQNILYEVEEECNIAVRDYTLKSWANNGVLLLNSVLTVRSGSGNSHSKLGWQQFTDSAIKFLDLKDSVVVYLLWGAHAQSKKSLITNKKHIILESANPSPSSVFKGFFGNGHFKKVDDIFKNTTETSIWRNKGE